MISHEDLLDIRNNPDKVYVLELSPQSSEYRTTRAKKQVFDGCNLNLTVRYWAELDKRKQFVYTIIHEPTGETFRLTVLKARLRKENNPVEVHYVRVADDGTEIYPEVFMTGVFDATYAQAREMLTHAKEIRPFIPKGKKPTAVYKDYLDRWGEGESYTSLRSEWIEKNRGKEPKLFYKAFYRQDKEFFSKEPLKKTGAV